MEEESKLQKTKKGKEESQQKEIPEVTLQFHKTKVYGRVISSKDASEFIRSLYPEGTIEMQEQSIVVYMNRANKIIGYYRHSMGGVSGTVIDTRLVLAAAIKSLSSSFIIAHNHPSGELKPSQEDLKLTQKMKAAGITMDIALLDHLILTKDGYYSFADEGNLGEVIEDVENLDDSKLNGLKQKAKDMLEGTEDETEIKPYPLKND